MNKKKRFYRIEKAIFRNITGRRNKHRHGWSVLTAVSKPKNVPRSATSFIRRRGDGVFERLDTLENCPSPFLLPAIS